MIDENQLMLGLERPWGWFRSIILKAAASAVQTAPFSRCWSQRNGKNNELNDIALKYSQ